MSSPTHFLSLQFLAEHQHFVRRLALGLARDEAAAEDLVQETWLAALTSSSQAIVRPRAWLATAMRRRALNVARSEDVRQGHEARAARGEASEDARMHERVSFQHSVVAAVLELEEPYRSVVMLRYFQDLSPAAIARRRKIPAATVRSQLARAHAQLRARLEAREGGREAWCMALAGFLDHSKPALVASSAVAITAGALVIVGGIGGALVWAHRAPEAIEGVVATVEPGAPVTKIVEPESEPARVTVQGNVPASTLAVQQEGPSSEDLASRSLDELRDMLTRVEDELRIRLLVPQAEVVASWSAAHPNAGMEFGRVLDGTRFEGLDCGFVGIRSGGAFFSFVTRSNSYDDQPTIGLGRGEFSSSFYGASQAVLLDMGSVDPSSLPANLAAKESQAFAVLSHGPALPKDSSDPGLNSMLDGRKLMYSKLALQHTYLLRSVFPNEHDILAIFVPIQQDPFGVTLAWRVVQSWPVPELRNGQASGPPRKTLDQDPGISSLSTDGLLALFDRIRLRTTAQLMAIPDSLRAQSPDRPLARLLRDYWGTRFVNINGGGRFFNFASSSNDYQDAPDVDMQGEYLSGSANTGRPTLLMDLGVANVDQVTDRFPPPTDATAKRVWDLAWTFERRTPSPTGNGPAIVTPEEFQLFYNELRGGGRPPRATVGHTYLVRSIIPGKHDHLVAFEILAEDEHGIFITWRILKTWPA